DKEFDRVVGSIREEVVLQDEQVGRPGRVAVRRPSDVGRAALAYAELDGAATPDRVRGLPDEDAAPEVRPHVGRAEVEEVVARGGADRLDEEGGVDAARVQGGELAVGVLTRAAAALDERGVAARGGVAREGQVVV